MVLRSAVLVLSLLAFSGAELAAEASLRGSPAGMRLQNQVARDHGLAFYRTTAEIDAAVEVGDLVPLTGNEDYSVADFVDRPYLHPAALLFVERLSRQYREACGQKLVVTSAVRATSRQPANAHALSVHPTGMAVDLRVSDRAECRAWLEDAILGMERRELIDGIREYNPPHYHVAIFPNQYLAYALERAEREMEFAASDADAEEPSPASAQILAASASALREPVTEPGSTIPAVFYLLSALVAGVPFAVTHIVRRRRG